MGLIECKELTLGYERENVIENLSFCVKEGDYLSVVGENGAGKSTLVKAILGLLKPISGEIVYSKITRNDIGYLPQNSESERDFPASVSEVVYSGFLGKKGFRPFYTKEEKITADGYMFLVGVADKKKKCFAELSGGQQQRVLLARALCAAEKLILLDEPTSALDPKASIEFYKLTDTLNKGNKVTVISITHDIRAALEHSSHILHLSRSECFFGSVEDYKNSSQYARFVLSEGNKNG